ncbi:hypothetical protein OJ996_23700 [Luteolibacter sp. GHJ8]|uniref:Uncharacterized protein n=1 Tax=Luteolibacter rhizosphaerae TaxID=2989719 RepID=A0ABT3G9T8_9BACT|nr:hypothetical protein [Luteolibacter rhizosphaerae]MCW1916612.1 hypothetical protein [Luteolibacter rhizosphaerae]
MTNKEIIAKIEAAGHQVTGNLNRTKLEALAAERGVSLEEPTPEPTPEDGSGTTADPVDDGYDQNRLITPVMAVCAIAGDAAKVELASAAEESAE